MLEALSPTAAFAGLRDFLQTGGNVLFVIMIATFVLWAFIIERFWFYATSYSGVVKRAMDQWARRTDHKSWHAHAIRERLISEVRQETERSLPMIKVMVAVAPLLGLLGTVTGMVEVFDVMAVTGSSNARALASGVSKATIPTMAGLVASLSGVLFANILDRRSSQSVQKVADQLTLS
ncbi:MAG: MotA/TolQ/ExbB proton channel family protein [Pseudomonadota bacterium]